MTAEQRDLQAVKDAYDPHYDFYEQQQVYARLITAARREGAELRTPVICSTGHTSMARAPWNRPCEVCGDPVQVFAGSTLQDYFQPEHPNLTPKGTWQETVLAVVAVVFVVLFTALLIRISTL